jgi:hypothetical protein
VKAALAEPKCFPLKKKSYRPTPPKNGPKLAKTGAICKNGPIHLAKTGAIRYSLLATRYSRCSLLAATATATSH